MNKAKAWLLIQPCAGQGWAICVCFTASGQAGGKAFRSGVGQYWVVHGLVPTGLGPTCPGLLSLPKLGEASWRTESGSSLGRSLCSPRVPPSYPLLGFLGEAMATPGQGKITIQPWEPQSRGGPLPRRGPRAAEVGRRKLARDSGEGWSQPQASGLSCRSPKSRESFRYVGCWRVCPDTRFGGSH